MLKDTGKGLWDACFGGHMGPGIEAVDGAVLELKEESGLHAKPSDLQYIATIKHVSGNNKEFRHLFIYRWNGSVIDLKLEEDEVSEAKWIAIEEVNENRDNSAVWSPLPFMDALLENLR
jgi:isopentenyldiphosphate isomerase